MIIMVIMMMMMMMIMIIIMIIIIIIKTSLFPVHGQKTFMQNAHPPPTLVLKC